MTWITVVAVICGIIGIIGSIAPGLPGPPIGWVGLLLIFFWGGEGGTRSELSVTAFVIMTVLMVVVTILDYVLPGKLTKVTGGSKYASRGANVGIILSFVLGIFSGGIGVISIVLFPLLGAFLSELYWGGKNSKDALKSAGGSLLGLLAGTGVKLIYCCAALWMIIAN